MKRQSATKLKWIMVIIIITHLLCFFPNDVIPLPVVIVETQLIDGFLKSEYTSDTISNLIVSGQILAITFLIFRFTTTRWVVGVLATILLICGNIVWLIYKNVSVGSFEFITSIPFIISAIIFWITGLKEIKTRYSIRIDK
jgi:hypothetical protein